MTVLAPALVQAWRLKSARVSKSLRYPMWKARPPQQFSSFPMMPKSTPAFCRILTDILATCPRSPSKQ